MQPAAARNHRRVSYPPTSLLFAPMRIGLIAMDGCFGVGVVSMLDLLQTAEALREQMDPAIPRIDVGVVGTRPRVITGSGVVLQTTAGLGDMGEFDVVVV